MTNHPLPPMIDDPYPHLKGREPDMRYVLCALDGYTECAAIAPAACICNQMPRKMYEYEMKRKTGWW